MSVTMIMIVAMPNEYSLYSGNGTNNVNDNDKDKNSENDDDSHCQ